MRNSSISSQRRWLHVLAISAALLVAAGARPDDRPMSETETRQVVQGIESNLAPKDFVALYAFTNHRTDGTTTAYEIQFQTKNVDHSRGRFLKPEREKGREILRADDALWTYLPSVGRAVRVADRDSFAGGDFSNADVMRVDWLNQYEPKLLKTSAKQWIIELNAKGKSASYARMRLWVDRATRQPVQQHFYDSSGTLIKKCLYGDVKSFGAVTRPARLMMLNVITGQKSEMKVIDLKTGQKLAERLFAVDNLGK